MAAKLLIFTCIAGSVLFSSIISSAEARSVAREPLNKEGSGSGSNIGGGNNGARSMVITTDDPIGIMRNSLSVASQFADKNGSHKESIGILIAGVESALRSEKIVEFSHFRNSLERGLEIIEKLDARNNAMTSKKSSEIYFYLKNYFQVTMDSIGIVLERAGQVYSANSLEFGKAFLNSLNSQLNFITSFLITEQYYPQGPSRAVLLISEVSMRGVLSEMETSPWISTLNSPMTELKLFLNETLGPYNLGNREVFEDDRAAIINVANKVKSLVEIMKLSNN